MKRRSPPRAAQRGFTLAELLVVLVLLGLMVGVVTPAIAVGLARPEPDGARAIATLLESVRARARQDAAAAEVVVDPVTARIWVRATRAGAAFDTTFVLPLPQGSALVASAPRVRLGFRADGGAWGDVLIVRDGLRSTRFTLDPLTGAVLRSDDAGVTP